MDEEEEASMAYGSARDLPKFKEMELQLAGLRRFKFLISKEQRHLLTDVSAQLDRITSTVDAFYVLLGPRHWVFHDDLPVDDLAGLVANHQDDPERAEQAFIAWYQDKDRLSHLVRRLNVHPDLRARMHLLRSALEDYQAQRYYAVVHVLLSVMDGFVNDLNPACRKGLHAREPQEMDAWDSVVGHHLGLSAAHATFAKSSKGRNDEPVYELYRNGIVHGMLTNYNSSVVATKAWNRLFAVADWARSLEAQEQETAKPPDPTWKDLATQLAANTETKAALAEFVPIALTSDDHASLAAHPVYVASTRYLDAWKRKNYGHMAQVITTLGQTVGPGDVRLDYQGHSLDDYSLKSLVHSAAAICTVRLHVVVNGTPGSPEMRWVREGSDGRAAAPNEDGEWRLMWWGAAHMTRDAE
ncbi:MAG: hypothetical protein L0J68_02660 [Micrococcaceae bacterium]|uniref:hypothetical protein n=1 Tax=unclassified Arthrobacter TaxID=235627 RepID=UPI0026560C6C|nr:hypothetical protein [Yaniella sp.]MDN5813076.1 hypothetical protein [Micrococcaceae bacterium]MDN5823957.1 hypothetical protein [Micrococcaceae bacterium]MDN6299177.1 hypothetical protein [Micrococcaceae bacterium]